MRFFILLLPWLELFTLIQLGIETSALTAIFYVLVTFVLGLVVIRRQGMDLVERLRGTQKGRVIGADLLVDEFNGRQSELCRTRVASKVERVPLGGD